MPPTPELEDVLTHVVPLGQALAVAQFLTSAILIPSAFLLVRRLGAIRDHLAALNSRTSKTEQWQHDHDQRVASDDHQYEIMRHQCQALHEERLDNINERISELWVRLGDRRQGRRPTD